MDKGFPETFALRMQNSANCYLEPCLDLPQLFIEMCYKARQRYRGGVLEGFIEVCQQAFAIASGCLCVIELTSLVHHGSKP